jgi:DNA-binding phage protein
LSIGDCKKIYINVLLQTGGTKMLKIEEIVERLKDRKLTVVARRTGINKQTLYNIMKGQLPTYDTLVKISDYLENN